MLNDNTNQMDTETNFTENSTTEPKMTSRKVYLEDFNDDSDDSRDKCYQDTKHKYNKNHSQNDNIAKNQQEFGHKKRIKP